MTNDINITSSITCKEICIEDKDENIREEENNDININNSESSINYISTKGQLNRKHVIVNETFAY